MYSVVRKDNSCRICGGKNIMTALKLNDTPLEDQFLREPKFQPTFPLELALCEDCGYLHLPYVINPEVSYLDYMYVSGVTAGLRQHFDAYAENIINNYNIHKGSFVIDLGSNDGSMLASFKRLNMKVLGVEPATLTAQLANEYGLPTINAFFTDHLAAQIVQEYGVSKVVTANYMYANIDDVISFTKAVTRLLDSDGIFVVETGYHPEQMKINMFDYIYHEHFSYFTVDLLRNIFSRCGLELIQAIKTKPKGGSIQVVAQLAGGNRPASSSIDDLISDEYKQGIRNIETYQQFGEQLQRIKYELHNLLRDLQSKGKKIIGFGASHSTTTLLYHFEIASYIDYIVDDNPLKHGTFSPGYHIPVHPSPKLYEEEKSPYILVLAWQHKESILRKQGILLDKGFKFILPLPELRIIKKY